MKNENEGQRDQMRTRVEHNVSIRIGENSMDITKLDITKVIDCIKEKRMVFYSEADFQFAFAWEIKSIYPEVNVRLEYAIRY